MNRFSPQVAHQSWLMVAVNVVMFWSLILVVSHNSEGESPWRFWTFQDGGSGLYLPAEGPPGAWSVDGFRLRDLNTVTIGDLPARFDWSIMGWTILLLALMNLKEKRRRRKRREGGREEEEEEAEGTQTQKHSQCISQNKIRQKLLTKTFKSLSHRTKTNTLPNLLLSLR